MANGDARALRSRHRRGRAVEPRGVATRSGAARALGADGGLVARRQDRRLHVDADRGPVDRSRRRPRSRRCRTRTRGGQHVFGDAAVPRPQSDHAAARHVTRTSSSRATRRTARSSCSTPRARVAHEPARSTAGQRLMLADAERRVDHRSHRAQRRLRRLRHHVAALGADGRRTTTTGSCSRASATTAIASRVGNSPAVVRRERRRAVQADLARRDRARTS